MKKIERKDFIKLGGGAVVGGLTGFVFSGAPFKGFQWVVEWTQDQYVPTRGIENFVQSINQSCPDKCQVSVRKISKRAVQLSSTNGVCPSCQNALQLLYHPERIQKPLKKIKNGKYKEVTWDIALKEIGAELKKSAAKSASISKGYNLSSYLTEKLISAAGSKNNFIETSGETIAQATLGGIPQYNIENSDYVLSFGARVMEGWGSSKASVKLADNMRKGYAKLVQVDTNATRTASMATQWINVKPGTEAILAMSIAGVLINKYGKSTNDAGFLNIMSLATQNSPEKAEKITGVPKKTIEAIAAAFALAKRPAALSGNGGVGVSASSAEILAVYTLNRLVNSAAVSLVNPVGFSKSSKLDEFIKKGSFDFMIISEANPVYKSVYGADLAKKLEKAFVVALAPIQNDTTYYADYILPTLSFLEVGNKTAVSSDGRGKNCADILDSIAKASGLAIPAGRKATGTRAAGYAIDYNYDITKPIFKSMSKIVEKDSKYPLYMMPYEATLLGDGDGLAYPYVLKTLDSQTFSYEKMCLHINSKTAKDQGVSDGSCVDIESANGTIENLTVVVTDTVAPDVVAVPLGFGHKNFTKYGSNKGSNPKTIMAKDIDPLSGSANWWITRVKLS
jgi:anaerobic selenocysteine-containing dehydrogenase